MRTIHLKKTRQCAKLIGETPKRGDYGDVIRPPALLIDDSAGFFTKTIGVYLKLPDNSLEIAKKIVREAKATKGLRTYGLPTNSAVFGALPRIEIRQDYCRFTRNTVDQCGLMPSVLELSESVCSLYNEYLEKDYKKHVEMSEKDVLQEWLMPGTPFTTINFNLNHAIRYHRDTVNQKGTKSNVIIVKDGATGGELVLPEYRVALSQEDGAVIIFDGQQVIHGVMPIAFNDNGYRASIVLYTLRGMKNCYPFAEELDRAKQNRTRIEEEYRTRKSHDSIRKSVRLMDNAIRKNKHEKNG